MAAGFLIIVGIISGFLSGMFGMGGGLTVIPALAFTLVYFNVSNSIMMHVAIGTSLSIMFVNSIYSALQHNKAINWQVIKQFLPFIIVGTVIGSIGASYASTNALLAVYLLFMAYVIFARLYRHSNNNQQTFKPTKSSVIAYGTITGIISTTVGGGSSLMMVPFLTKRGFTVQQAVAISSVFNVFLALTGMLSYIVLGLRESMLPKYSIGYVYLPACILILLGSFVGVPLGVKVLKFIDDKTAQLVYFGWVVFIFIIMLIKFISSAGFL